MRRQPAGIAVARRLLTAGLARIDQRALSVGKDFVREEAKRG